MSTMRPRRWPGLGETEWLRLSLAGLVWDTGHQRGSQVGHVWALAVLRANWCPSGCLGRSRSTSSKLA
eukprot:3994925-Pyramimonas_sp.AAC.1